MEIGRLEKDVKAIAVYSDVPVVFYAVFAPLLLNIPLFGVLKIMFTNGVESFSATATVYQLVGLSGVLLGVFALYFIISYIITWYDLKKHLRAEIRS